MNEDEATINKLGEEISEASFELCRGHDIELVAYAFIHVAVSVLLHHGVPHETAIKTLIEGLTEQLDMPVAGSC